MTITIRGTYGEEEGELPDPTLTAPTLTLAASADSGTDSDDKITNVENLIFNSVVTAASEEEELTWRLYKDGVFRASVVATGGPVVFSGVSGTEGTNGWTVTIQKADTTISYPTVTAEVVTIDLTPPILSSPAAATLSPTAINISVTTDTGEGQIRYVGVLGGSTPPEDWQVWAGIDADDEPALKSGNFSVGSPGVKTTTISSLENLTEYDFYWVHRDIAENLSGVATATATTAAGSGHCIAYDNWLLRINPSLPTQYKDAYGDLLDALTAAGLFEADGTTDYFDGLWIAKTYDEDTSLIDLTDNEHDLTVIGSPVFTADVGWTGAASSALDTGFSVGLGGRKFSTLDCHMMTWNETNTEDVYTQAMGTEGAGGGYTNFYTKEVFEHKWYVRMNGGGVIGTTYYSAVTNPTSDCRGFLLASRTGTTIEMRQNQYQFLTVTGVGSDSPGIPNVYLLSGNNGTIINETGRTHSAWSIGAYIDETKAIAFHAALAQFWTDIA